MKSVHNLCMKHDDRVLQLSSFSIVIDTTR